MLLKQTELDSTSLHITLNKGTIQLIRSLLSTMLVRVDVQCNHQNETNCDGNSEYGDDHYSSIIVGLITRGPESLHLIHPHAFARIVEVFKLLRNSILYV